MDKLPNDNFSQAGMAWWNALDEHERAKWLSAAGSAVPADAYAAYLSRRSASTPTSSVLDTAIHLLATNPDSPASLRIMSSVSQALAPRKRASEQLLEALEAQLLLDGVKEKAGVDAAAQHWERICGWKLTDLELAEHREEARKRIESRKRQPPSMKSILERAPTRTDTGYKLGVHLYGIEGTWHRLWAVIALASSFGSDVDTDEGVAAVKGQFETVLERPLTHNEWKALVAHAANHAATVMKPAGPQDK